MRELTPLPRLFIERNQLNGAPCRFQLPGRGFPLVRLCDIAKLPLTTFCPKRAKVGAMLLFPRFLCSSHIGTTWSANYWFQLE